MEITETTSVYLIENQIPSQARGVTISMQHISNSHGEGIFDKKLFNSFQMQ